MRKEGMGMNLITKIKSKYRLFAAMIIVSCLLLGVYLYRSSLQLENNVRIADSEIADEIKMIETDGEFNIFDMEYQDFIQNLIDDEKKGASISQPFLIYDPFGTNSDAVNVYFNESVENVSYTIKTDGYADYSQTLKTDQDDGYQIIGLVAGETNTLILNVNDQSFTYTLKMPKSPSNAANQLEITDGESQEALSNGLFAMLGKDTRSNIFLYDNNGTLRSELIVDDSEYRSDRVLTIDDQLVYTYDKRGFLFVNRQGKIEKIMELDGYYMHHDFIYDQQRHSLLILANKDDDDTIEDRVVSLNIKTGKTQELVNMKELLPEMYETAEGKGEKNTYGGDELDWIHLNSLSLMDDGSLLVSSRELSTIIKITDLYDEVEIDYMISDESIYEDLSYQDLILDKVSDFSSQAGQHAVTYSRDEDMESGCYYVSLFNNNYGKMSTRSDYDWSNIEGVGTYQQGTCSYYYKYLVNENTGTYTLVDSIVLPYSAIVSSIEYYDGHIQTSSGKDLSFAEYDASGNLIREFEYEAEEYAYRVLKYSFDLWFE